MALLFVHGKCQPITSRYTLVAAHGRVDRSGPVVQPAEEFFTFLKPRWRR